MSDKVKSDREERFHSVSNNIMNINREFDNFRKTKFKKFRDKQRSLEQQRSMFEKEIMQK